MPELITFDNFDRTKLKITNRSVRYGEEKFTKNIGNCRRVYRVGNVIIKFDYSRIYGYNDDSSHQTPAECKFYRKIKKQDLKFFPRTKELRINGKIVELQEFIDGKPYSAANKKAYEIVNKLQRDYNRCDYHSNNVVLLKKNHPVVVDFGL